MSLHKLKIIGLSVLYVLITTTSYSQKAKITEIRLFANKEFFSPVKPYPTIFYPIIHLKDTNVQRRINQNIYLEIVRQGNSIIKELNNRKKEGLTDITYEITMNQKWILSLKISVQESGGHHLIDYTTYFNFDLHTGKEIKIDDLLDRNQKDSFERKVFADKLDSLMEYRKKEVVLLQNNPNDSDTYKWAIESVDDCMTEASLEVFSLYPGVIEFIDECGFPTIIRYQEPEYHLKYVFKTYYYILNKKYRKAFMQKD